MAALSRLLAVTAIFVSFLLTPSFAHPGERYDHAEVLKVMRARGLEALEQRSQYEECQNSAGSLAREERAILRRAATVQRLREERGLLDEPFIHRRNLAQFMNYEKKSHDKTSAGLKYNNATAHAVMFGTSVSCTLIPDNANGPYCDLGEQIRSDVREGQPGVPMHLELQFVDVTTCKSFQPLVVDIWSCNATGVYSGVSAAGEGGLAATFLRSVQQTDPDGVVNFDTIFPGHYSGRATHEHALTHTGATINANTTAPYNTNKIPHTQNDYDGYTGYAASAAYDPLPNYIQLGSSLSSGLFVWHTFGIKPSNNWATYGTDASYRDAAGGHDDPKFNFYIVGTPPTDAGSIYSSMS